MRTSRKEMRRWKSLGAILMMAAIMQPLSACSNKSTLDSHQQQPSLFDSNGQTYQSNSDVSVKTINIDRNFKGIDVEMRTHVTFEQSKELSVKVSIPKSMQKKVMVYYEGGIIKSKAKSNISNAGNDGIVRISIKAPLLQSVDLSGASQLDISGSLQQKEELELDASGASSIRCGELSGCRQLEIDLSGASNITINSVSCGTIDIDQSGASSSTLQKINGGNVSLDLSGASSILLSGSMKALTSDVSGCSTLTLKGRADKTYLGVSGVSKVDCKEFYCNNYKESVSGNSKITR